MTRSITHWILSCILCASSFSLLAQQYSFSYQSNAGNPGGLNTEGDATAAGWTNIITGPQSNNVWSDPVSIPFYFRFFGEEVTHFKVSQNGLITFDTAATTPTSTNEGLPSTLIPDKTIACFWDQFTASPPTASGDDIRYAVFGTAPNRQFWIRWYSFEIGNPLIGFVYIACVLEESTNSIYIVDQYSATTTSINTMYATVGLQNDNLEYIQADDSANVSGNGSGMADNDYYAFTWADSLDIHVVQKIQPSATICSGSANVSVLVKNMGATVIDSLDLGYTINGGSPDTVSYTGLALSTYDTVTLSLGTFPLTSGTTYEFIVYAYPNEVVDDFNLNDTLTFNVATGLNGNYTIDAANATSGNNFQSFTDADYALTTFGVCGPVVFDISADTFTESFHLVDIDGVSATNTLTFNGSGALGTVLTHNGANNATFLLNGTGHVTIKNMTIATTSTVADAWCLHLSHASDSVTIDSCRFIMPVGTTTDVKGIVASEVLTAATDEDNNTNYLTVTNSYFRGGETGIHLEGPGTVADYNVYNTIENCVFEKHDDEAFEVDNQRFLTLRGNRVDSITNVNADGFTLVDVDDFTVEANVINVPDYGIYIEDGNDSYVPTVPSPVVNNMVASTGDYGIYLNDFEVTSVYHNTVSGTTVGLLINDAPGVDIRNNIFHSLTGFAFSSTDTLTAADTIDFNMYYSGSASAMSIGGTPYNTLADWVTAAPGLNAHSIFQEPSFAALDLHLVNDVFANNAGDSTLGINVDIDGDTRPLGGAFDIGADEFLLTLPLLDLSLDAVLGPNIPLCPGPNNIFIKVFNGGINTIDSINIVVTANASDTDTVTFTGLSLATAEADTLDLGPFNFNTGVAYTFSIYSFAPNGNSDTTNQNDTLIYADIKAALTGNFTIDAGSATGGTNYQSFAEVAYDLNTYGVCGPTVIHVASDVYTEAIQLNEVMGSSAVNTITFDGGDALTTVLTHDADPEEATFRLNGTDHITIKNITLETTTTTVDAWCLHLSNASDSVTVDSCRIIMPIGTTGDVQGIVASSSLTAATGEANNANYLTVSNSYFLGGETGVHLEGPSAAANYTVGNTIENCHFEEHVVHGIEVDNQRDLTIRGNHMENMTNAAADGIYLIDVDDFRVLANQVMVADYGIYIEDGNDGFTPSSPSHVVNNMVVSTGDYGIYMNDFESSKIFHNTVQGATSALIINDQINADIRNNVLYNPASYAFTSTDTLASVDVVNYNLYYSGATNKFTIGGTNYASLGAWQTAAAAFNTNSLYGEPWFVSQTDLHLVNGLANNTGDNSAGIAVDIDGDSRPASTTVDMGADEYTPLSNDLQAFEVISPTNSACEDSLQYIDVVIRNVGSNAQTSVPVQIAFTGALNTTYADTALVTLSGFTMDTLTFGPVSTVGGGSVLLTISTQLAGDQNILNNATADSLEIVILPGLPSLTGDTVCEGDTATLTASGTEQSFRWYLTSSSVTEVHNGSSFSFVPSGNTSYWVAQTGNVIESVGPLSTAIGSSANFASTTAQSLLFTAVETFTLDSVTLFPNSSGNVQIVLMTSGGTTITSTTVAVTPSSALAPVRVPVGFTIPPGDYRLGAGSGTTTGGLARNSTGGSYPYTSTSGAAVITGNTFNNSAYYYYYYNWRISIEGCEGPRSEVMAIVDSISVALPADTTICAEDQFNLSPGIYESYEWQDGSAASTYTVSSADTFAVTVTNVTGCEATDEMVVSEYVIDVSLGADTNICPEDQFTLAPGSYSSYAWNDGSSAATYMVTSSDTVAVTVTNSAGCEASDTVTVEDFESPVVNLGADTSICPEDQITLVPGAFATYLWSDNTSTATYVVDAAQTVALTVTDGNGCEGMDEIIVGEHLSPVVDLGSDTAFCAGQTAILDAGSGFTGYEWQDNSSNQTLSVNAAGLYAVTVTDANTCLGSDSINVEVNALPVANAGPDTVICEGDTLPLAAGTGGNTHTWTDSLDNEVTQVLLPGNYYLLVTDTNGCEARDTMVVSECLGIETFAVQPYTVYPNPTRDVLNIRFDRAGHFRSLNIYDALGSVIYTQKLAAEPLVQVNLRHLAAGYYFLELNSDAGPSVQRIIVQ